MCVRYLFLSKNNIICDSFGVRHCYVSETDTDAFEGGSQSAALQKVTCNIKVKGKTIPILEITMDCNSTND
jgi:hypothetical protein